MPKKRINPDDDFWDDPVWKQYEQDVLANMLPKLVDSKFTISICPNDEGDVKFWVELGASIMLDKPIVILALPGRHIPQKLRRIADRVIMADITTPLGQAEVSVLLEDFIKEQEKS